jgi:hypothetical protein
MDTSAPSLHVSGIISKHQFSTRAMIFFFSAASFSAERPGKNMMNNTSAGFTSIHYSFTGREREKLDFIHKHRVGPFFSFVLLVLDRSLRQLANGSPVSSSCDRVTVRRL